MDSTKTSRIRSGLLNLNRGIVWRLSRAVGAEDDVTAAMHLPGQVGLERFLEACRGRGVSAELLNTAREAVLTFHDVADQHSGDKRTLEILLANAGVQSTSADLEGARRAMFEGGCAVWGVRAEVRLRRHAVPGTPKPRRTRQCWDQADVAGYVGSAGCARCRGP